ncbi:hypothetical protein [Paractinoplanes rishiriensis]|uniref:Uncharacterized protein n=1 Tax=Paractinoplanes rishiriensis TaxID=1050105 RepID=A0A919K1I4_9ACTN|nr:hypothetical protein [Actinoplanes rishiriensis]GIE97114.1 hypothetical protein Ari01nite_45790 [Actinoplanes rishiriensis]
MHRVTLSAAELSLLATQAGVALPPGMVLPEPAADPDAWPATADAVLRRRGLVDGDDTPVPAVAATLTVLARPDATVHIEVTLPHQASTALFAVSGGLAASLRQLDDGDLELALFPAWELGTELAGAVPAPHRADFPDVVPAYASPAGTAGRRPRPPLPGGAQGSLAATVTSADGTTYGTVEWLATDTGWLGLQSVPGHDGAPGAAVQPPALTTWLAPALDAALAAAR